MKRLLDNLKEHYAAYIELVIGGGVLLLYKREYRDLNWDDMGKFALLLAATSLCLGFLLAIGGGVLKSLTARLENVTDHFVRQDREQPGIIPRFDEKIIPELKGASRDLAKTIKIAELMQRAAIWQGDYGKYLDAVLTEHCNINRIRFMGTLVGGPALLLEPLCRHLRANPHIQDIHIIASQKTLDGRSLYYYPLRFLGMLFQRMLLKPDFSEWREHFKQGKRNLSVQVKYVDYDIGSATMILGSDLFNIAPSHGLTDWEEVQNFYIGLVVRRNYPSAPTITGGQIIDRQVRIFDGFFGTQPDDVWSLRCSADDTLRLIVERAFWTFEESSLRFGQPQSADKEFTGETIEAFLRTILKDGNIIGPRAKTPHAADAPAEPVGREKAVPHNEY